MVRCAAIFPNQQVFTLHCDAEQNSSIRPELNVFRRHHKVPLTLKIHSSGFIRWSEVARAPKTNIGSKECGWGRAAMARCPGHITLDS